MQSAVEVTIICPDGSSLILKGRVAHARPGSADNTPGIGIEFDPIEASVDASLRAMLESVDAREPVAMNLEQLVSEVARLGSLAPYKILGVTEGESDIARLAKAYEELAARYHPTKNGVEEDPVRGQICQELLQLVRTAFESMA